MPHSYTSSTGSRHGTVTSMHQFTSSPAYPLPSVLSPLSAATSSTEQPRHLINSEYSPILLANLESTKSLHRPATHAVTVASRFTRRSLSVQSEPTTSNPISQSQDQVRDPAPRLASGASRFTRRSSYGPSVTSGPTGRIDTDISESAQPISSDQSRHPTFDPVQIGGSIQAARFRADQQTKVDSAVTLTHASRFRKSQQASVESCGSGSSLERDTGTERQEPSVEPYVSSSPPRVTRQSGGDSSHLNTENLATDKSIVEFLDCNAQSFANDESVVGPASDSLPLANTHPAGSLIDSTSHSSYSIFSQPPDAKSTPVRIHHFRPQPKVSPSKLYPLTHGKGILATGAMDSTATQRTSETIASRSHAVIKNFIVEEDEQDIYEHLQTLQARNFELEAQAKTITDIFKNKLAESRADVTLKARVIEENSRVIHDQNLMIANQGSDLNQKIRMIEARDISISQLKQQLTTSERSIQSLQQTVVALQESNARLDREVVDLMAQREDTMAFVANVTERDAKDSKICELQLILDSRESSISKQDILIKELRHVIDTKESAVSEQNNLIKDLNQNLLASHTAMATRKNQIDKLKGIVHDIQAETQDQFNQLEYAHKNAEATQASAHASAMTSMNKRFKDVELKLAFSTTKCQNLEERLSQTEHALSSSTEHCLNLKKQLAQAEHDSSRTSAHVGSRPTQESEGAEQHQISQDIHNISHPHLLEPQRTGQYELPRNIQPSLWKQRQECPETFRAPLTRKSPPPTYEEDPTVRPVQSPTSNCQHLINIFTEQLNTKKDYLEVTTRAYASHNAMNRRAARQHLRKRIDETIAETETLSEYVYILQDIMHAVV